MNHDMVTTTTTTNPPNITNSTNKDVDSNTIIEDDNNNIDIDIGYIQTATHNYVSRNPPLGDRVMIPV